MHERTIVKAETRVNGDDDEILSQMRSLYFKWLRHYRLDLHFDPRNINL